MPTLPECRNQSAERSVSCTVSLEDKAAYITTEGKVSDDAMKQVVIDGGYQVISLTDAE